MGLARGRGAKQDNDDACQFAVDERTGEGVLRDVLGMTGTKFGCGMALCGACTVHLDGVASRSCITYIESIGTSEVTTIEAIGLPLHFSPQ
jgi:aerobic-type carbon monoxide dehydrogenase small subunit (CoxS/CutS family)